MRIAHNSLRQFERSYRWFSVGTLGPDRLRERASGQLAALDSDNEGRRAHAVKTLGLVCFLDLGKPGEPSNPLLSLFEFYAKFSQHEDVRFGCLEALYLCRDLERLRGVTCEPGNAGTDNYRRHLVSELRAELYPPMKC